MFERLLFIGTSSAKASEKKIARRVFGRRIKRPALLHSKGGSLLKLEYAFELVNGKKRGEASGFPLFPLAECD